MRGRRLPWVLPLGDAAAILLFVLIGLASHGEGIGVSGLARTALPVLAVWFAVAPILGTYRRPVWRVVAWRLGLPKARRREPAREGRR